jgi:cellobiose-specific phosphotransferase system component IIC
MMVILHLTLAIATELIRCTKIRTAWDVPPVIDCFVGTAYASNTTNEK